MGWERRRLVVAPLAKGTDSGPGNGPGWVPMGGEAGALAMMNGGREHGVRDWTGGGLR